MTTFSEFAARASGVGVNWVIQVGTALGNDYVWGLVGTTNLSSVDPRIVNMSALDRGFPADHGMQASSITVTLDNTDGGASWLLAVAGSLTNFNKYNYTLICEMYDVTNPTDYATKTLGIFELLDWPVRGEGIVTIQLVDHARGRGAALIELPSVRDWCAATDANRPAWLTTAVLNGAAASVHPNLGTTNQMLARDFDPDAPLPVWFGPNPMTPTYVGGDVYVMCAVAGAAGSLPVDDIEVMIGDRRLPSVLPTLFDSSFGTTPLWTIRRSATITKNSKSWHIFWMTLDLSGYADSTRTNATDIAVHQAGVAKAMAGTLRTRSDATGYGTVTTAEVEAVLNTVPKDAFVWAIHETNARNVSLVGYLWSHPVDDASPQNHVPGATIVEDLFEYYTTTPQTIDGASFDAVRAVRRVSSMSGALARGNWRLGAFSPSMASSLDGDLAPALRSICSLTGFDVFFTWAGTIKAVMMVADLTTVSTTPTPLDETTFVSISDRVHGAGERHRPFNRAFIRGADGKRYGPVDTNTGLAELRQVVEREFDGSWMATPWFEPNERDLRGAFPVVADGHIVRPVVTVRTGLNGLNLELGEYVSLTWTNETGGTNYSNTAFRVEAIRVDPMACAVELEMVYVQALFDGTSRPYLLDNETTSTRATGSGGRTATLTTGSGTVTFSSGSLITDGVAVSDQLIVLDPTESTTGFSRNRVLEIIGVGGATSLTVSETDFGSGGPFVISAWEIRRSYLTFRANAQNYGKTCQSNGQFSDSTTANKLLDG